MSPSNSFFLDVKNLTKKFGTVTAVKDLTFQISKGEIFGFLGPNGAGKSTTMKIITCFIPASSGTVVVDGLDIGEHSLDVRKKIGYLPETTPLYNEMTVIEYLDFVGQIRGLKNGMLRARIDEMLVTCGLTKMANRPISILSKGYRQRVGLAQAMLHNPDLLILDEPTSGLDPNQIIEIRQLIKKIGKEKTVIYCSHILSEVSATCTKVLIINNGVLVAIGTPEEITRLNAGPQRYRLRLKASDPNLIVPKLQGVEGVSIVSMKEKKDQWDIVDIVSYTREDIGERLFKEIVANGWSLAELRLESVTLEDVFTQLTRG